MANGACITTEINGSNILHHIDINVKQEFLDELTQHKDYPSLIAQKAKFRELKEERFTEEQDEDCAGVQAAEGATPFLQAVIHYCNWTPSIKEYTYYDSPADIVGQNNIIRGKHTKLVSSHSFRGVV